MIYKFLSQCLPRQRLFTVFLPALLWGDIFEAQAVPAAAQRVYRPTRAQQRAEEEARKRDERVQALRSQNQAKQSSSQQQNTPPADSSAGVPGSARIRYAWIDSRRFVLLQDVARFYNMKISYQKDGVALKGNDSINISYDKRTAVLNGVNIYLTYPPVQRGALVYLDEKDFLLVIDPVLRDASLWSHPLGTVMIDPGHGGKDNGAPGSRTLLEKNVNLTLATKLSAKLRSMGYRVIMTRTDDRFISLQQRAEMCEKSKPGLFISIHCNATERNRSIRGIETYAMTPQDAASTNETKRGAGNGPGNSFDKNNYRLAYEVQKNLLTMTRTEDRGVKHARFFVLRNATCPAILIETGFITHPAEGAQLAQNAYQDKIVAGIVAGISSYAKIMRPSDTPKKGFDGSLTPKKGAEGSLTPKKGFDSSFPSSR